MSERWIIWFGGANILVEKDFFLRSYFSGFLINSTFPTVVPVVHLLTETVMWSYFNVLIFFLRLCHSFAKINFLMLLPWGKRILMSRKCKYTVTERIRIVYMYVYYLGNKIRNNVSLLFNQKHLWLYVWYLQFT